MRLLVKSFLRHMREHLLQTLLTVAVTILVTGMLAVLFDFASSFQRVLRTYALEKYGDYHYRYDTHAGTEGADLLAEMERRFQEDDWFSKVELKKEDGEVYLFLTAAHPGLLTTRTMKGKFDRAVRDCYDYDRSGMLYVGQYHNYELLASYGDLCRENGIYVYLGIFLVLVTAVAAAGILTLGAIFWVSAMQRERETALLSGIGAGPGQIVGMILIESVLYCLFSLPAGYFLGICVYRGIQGHVDNIIYSLFRFPSAELVVSVPSTVALIVCAVGIILLSGLKTAVRMSRVSPMEALRRTKEISIRQNEGMGRSTKNRSAYDKKTAAGVENWLARKSCQRFKRRYRPILIMLTVTFALCFVLNGVQGYATEIVEMTYDIDLYNFEVDLYSDEKEDMERLADELVRLSDSRLKTVREAMFLLREPYPFSELWKSTQSEGGGIVMLPDAALLCIDEEEFLRICEELEIPGEQGGIWGIFLNDDRTWWSDGVMVKGQPYEVAAGDKIRLYDSAYPRQGEEEILLTVVGVCDESPLYTKTTAGARMQILVPETVFCALETKSPYSDPGKGMYHVSLRGSMEDCSGFEKLAEGQIGKFTAVDGFISNYDERMRRQKAGIASFEFLCQALIGIFAFICICGNFTVSWAIGRARERESATFLSVGMKPGGLQKMRLIEQLHNVMLAFWPGVAAGMCGSQLIYWMCSTQYRVAWHFPLKGLALGMTVLAVAVGVTDLALWIAGGRKTLAQQLRMEE